MASKLSINRDLNNRNTLVRGSVFKQLNNILYDDKYINIYYSHNEFGKYKTKRMIRNRCIITGRARAVESSIRLTRMAFKMCASKGLLPGIIKHSW